MTDPTEAGRETGMQTSLCTGSKALEGWIASRGSLFATGGNAVNPMVVSRAQQTCTIAEEQAVGVVRNHEDGTRLARGSAGPMARRWQHRRAGSGLCGGARRRGVFGKPQERNSDVIDIGTLGPERVGKKACKVKRVDAPR